MYVSPDHFIWAASLAFKATCWCAGGPFVSPIVLNASGQIYLANFSSVFPLPRRKVPVLFFFPLFCSARVLEDVFGVSLDEAFELIFLIG